MKYQIWNKQDTIYTPSGAAFTAEEWKERYKWAKLLDTKCVVAAGTFNGGFMAEFEQFKDYYKKNGATITDNMTDEEVLAVAETFDDRKEETEPTAEERIAAALEFQNLNSLEG